MTQDTQQATVPNEQEAHADYLSTGSQIATISTFLILLAGLFTAWLTKKIRSSMRGYTERLSKVETQLANSPIATENNQDALTIPELNSTIEDLLTDIEERMEQALITQKKNSREHLQNEIKTVRADLIKELAHVQELLTEKIEALKANVKEGKDAILTASEQALAAQLQLSDVQARLDMINQRLNSQGS